MPVSTYLQLVPRVQTGLSTFPATLLVVDKLQETAREFARETLALREDFDIDLSEGVRNYRLASADGLVVHKVAAVFRRSLYDIVNGRDGEPLNPAQFALLREREIDDGLVVTTSQDGYADEGVYSLTGETLNDLPVFASAEETTFCSAGLMRAEPGSSITSHRRKTMPPRKTARFRTTPMNCLRPIPRRLEPTTGKTDSLERPRWPRMRRKARSRSTTFPPPTSTTGCGCAARWFRNTIQPDFRRDTWIRFPTRSLPVRGRSCC